MVKFLRLSSGGAFRSKGLRSGWLLSDRRTAFGPRLRLPRHRALPDRVPPPLAEGEHHRELELAGGRGRIKILGH